MKQFKYILIFVILLACFDYSPSYSAAKKSKAKTSKVVSKKESKSKKSSKKLKKKKRKAKARSVKIDLSKFEILKVDTLGDGAILKKYSFGKGKVRTIAQVVELDLDNNSNIIAVGKAQNRANGLQKVYEIARRYDSLSSYDTYAAINANFWKAYSNRAIAPLISSGEVIEKESYKGWTSGFMDVNNKLYIDRFKIESALYNSKGEKLTDIDLVNHRSEPNSVVLYNKYFGDTIPKPTKIDIKEVIKEALSDTLYSELDSTEEEIDVDKVVLETKKIERSVDIEESIKKLTLRYLDNPALNKNIKCVVQHIDTGYAVIPELGGCIISLGDKSALKIKKGDTLLLKFETDKYKDVIFTNAVSGTPRLVRNGNAKHEALEEGSKAARFIKANLPRSAVGVNKDNTIAYLVAFPCYISDRSVGVNLEQEATIMKKIGAYNAFNLDGGGSTSMAIKGENICSADPKSGRKVSAALVFGTKKKLKAQK